MTSEAKSALSRTIRKLRATLIRELGEATDGAYRLSIDAKKAALREAARIRRARLEGWIAEQVRALPADSREGAAERFRDDVVKDAAATLLQRLVYLRLLEAASLRPDPIVTGGWESRGYKDFREAAPELVRPDRRDRDGVRDETEGYATLLQLVFDELAIDLPGLYGPVRMTSLVPIPAATLRTVVTALDDEELASVWTDDTTLGWIYQYWNDPEREALDAKLAASKKLENHEIASKTQMFTERYMVEWLLHNSLGQMWLAMCRKHGWTADVERPGPDGKSLLDRLDARRADWRAKRESGAVALDALMPIEPGLEDRWKYWVPQPMPDDAVTHAPDSIRTLKLLDPACGSGHFLVIATELLFHLYLEEARHRGETWSDREIVESILENNLHGIDIDPRAVQIAAAALMLKARQLCRIAAPRTINLVAPNFRLHDLGDEDSDVHSLYTTVEAETGIAPELSSTIVSALAGADHLGSLLKIEAEIDSAIDAWEDRLSTAVATTERQGSLAGLDPRRQAQVTAEHARTTLVSQFERFLAHHTRGADLGLRLRGEQLAAGVRFVRMIREAQYDLVVGNPPYQGTTKMADKAYIEKHYPRGKADLYAAFMERGVELVRDGGISALLTMRNWMFLAQFSALRDLILGTHDLRMLGDLSSGAFEEIAPAQVVVTVAMSIVRRWRPSSTATIAMRFFDDRCVTEVGETARKRSAMLVHSGRFEFFPASFTVIAGKPLIYWWPKDVIETYRATPKLGDIAPVQQGMKTSDNVRFLLRPWEVHRAELEATISSSPHLTSWAPCVRGAIGKTWFEPLDYILRWRHFGLEIKSFNEHLWGSYTRNITSEEYYFKRGIAFSMIGKDFRVRAHRYPSVFLDKGSSIFGDDVEGVLCALNSTAVRAQLAALNPSISFQVGDVRRVALPTIPKSNEIVAQLHSSFTQHEAAREPSCEFRRPGPSSWHSMQQWAQRAIDKTHDDVQISDFVLDPESAIDHLSFAIGVALGRFGVNGEGILTTAPATALSCGILYLSEASDEDSLADPASAVIRDAWTRHGANIDDKRALEVYLVDRFFEVHRRVYENRPIYFPLSSSKKSFVAFVSIHRWTAGALDALLADHLCPTKKRLEGEETDLKAVRDSGDKKAAKAAEKRLGRVGEWLGELNEFIANVEQCAYKGPPPVDGKTKAREVDAKYEMDLDDGVMVNAAALWPLLEPQWKDPKKWWKELANAEGKKDYDWSHLAKRYFPDRVDKKCKVDPSLAVAHGCFWKYHPAKAYQWELRLQDEIRPDFTIDEEGSDDARKAFEEDHPDEVEALVEKEQVRRQRKQAKADKADDGDESADAETDGEDADEDQEMSA